MVIIYAMVANGTYLEEDVLVGSAELNAEGTAYAEFDESVDKGMMIFDQYDLS